MKEGTSFSDIPTYSEQYPNRPKLVGIFFASLFLVIIILIGLYVLGATSKRSSSLLIPTLTPPPTKEVSPTQIPTITPKVSVTISPSAKPTISPTPAKTSGNLDKSLLKITILNGSGVPGAAKGISSYLSDL